MKIFGYTLAVAMMLSALGCSQDYVADVPTQAAVVSGSDVGDFSKHRDGVPPRIHEYEVTVYNLTSGQPLTPPTLATHLRQVNLFDVGEAASFEIKEIAENGNLDPMISYLEGNEDVRQLVVAAAGDPPPILPGASVTTTIGTYRGAHFLSFASMLVCTNDGFTGLDSVPLPTSVGASIDVYTDAYDAGTEVNTEDFADIVPPCQGLIGVTSDDEGTGASNPDLAENGVITHHAGVSGGNDLLDDPHGWSNPVARITITKIK